MARIRLLELPEAAMIWADGSLDGAHAPDLHRTVERVLASNVPAITLDLTGVSSLDEGVIAVIAAAAMQREGRGGTIELLLPRGHRATVSTAAEARELLQRHYPQTGRTC
ncbi:MAG: STAS domain-containing protein [Micromonosporaceae bacterium]|nr:STAS domain-containing protein [Micromonosporaceae bacterium]